MTVMDITTYDIMVISHDICKVDHPPDPPLFTTFFLCVVVVKQTNCSLIGQFCQKSEVNADFCKNFTKHSCGSLQMAINMGQLPKCSHMTRQQPSKLWNQVINIPGAVGHNFKQSLNNRS